MIKIDKADRTFSWFIRKRDGECVRCHSRVRFNDKGLPVSHQCSHYYGRGQEAVRIEPDNCDTLCMACHRIWGSDDREAYREFKIEQLGQDRFDALMVKAKTYHKKDRNMNYIIARELLKSLDSKEIE